MTCSTVAEDNALFQRFWSAEQWRRVAHGQVGPVSDTITGENGHAEHSEDDITEAWDSGLERLLCSAGVHAVTSAKPTKADAQRLLLLLLAP
jgi:hypothetical protein